jgi:hypothetical protein
MIAWGLLDKLPIEGMFVREINPMIRRWEHSTLPHTGLLEG